MLLSFKISKSEKNNKNIYFYFSLLCYMISLLYHFLLFMLYSEYLLLCQSKYKLQKFYIFNSSYAEDYITFYMYNAILFQKD